MWKLKVDFLKTATSAAPRDEDEDVEIDNIQWKQVNLTGKFPAKISHHQGIVQEVSKELIIYGGIIGIEASDVIYLVDLKNFSFTAIPAAQQKEKNGKALPGPRDDYALISVSGDQARVKPVFLIAGFKNGTKMNDVYKLHQDGKNFTWELIEVTTPKPEPRSSFAAVISSDDSFYLFGGSGDNNLKFNDLWQFSGTAWTQLSKGTIDNTDAQEMEGTGPDELPLQKSGHQISLFKNKYIIVFGGIHEITYEMNDLKVFDTVTKKWQTLEEENKVTTDNGSPRNKTLTQQQESTKKNLFTLKSPTLDGTVQL